MVLTIVLRLTVIGSKVVVGDTFVGMVLGAEAIGFVSDATVVTGAVIGWVGIIVGVAIVKLVVSVLGVELVTSARNVGFEVGVTTFFVVTEASDSLVKLPVVRGNVILGAVYIKFCARWGGVLSFLTNFEL